LKRIGFPTPGTGVFLLIGMFVALVFWTACQSGSSPPPSPPPENLVSGAPGPEDLEEQFYRIMSYMEGVEVGDEMSFKECASMILEGERLRDMFVDSSFVKDDWSQNDRDRWWYYWLGYIRWKDTIWMCSDYLKED